MSSEDLRIIEGFLNGDRAALGTIDRWVSASIQSFRPKLSYCWDDLLQDIRLDLVSRLKEQQFRGESRLITYVWRVAVNAAINRARRESHRVHAALEGIPPPSDPSPSALENAIRSEQRMTALRIIDEAAGPCREIWNEILRGRSYAEISAATGVAEGTLRARSLRCRKAAARLFERLQAEPAGTSGRQGES